MKSNIFFVPFCLCLLLIASPSFCDTISQDIRKNRFELEYIMFNGIGVSYLQRVSRYFYFDIYFGRNFYTYPSSEILYDNKNIEYICGIGLQNTKIEFGIFDFSLLYSLRERFLYYNNLYSYPYDKYEEFGTGLGINPKIQVNLLSRYYVYLAFGLFVENIITNHHNYIGNYQNPAQTISFDIKPDGQLGIGVKF